MTKYDANNEQGSTLLLVDDDLELCQMLSEYLRPEGFAVSCVHTGNEALTKLQCERVDLVVLDVMLPGLNGMEVLRSIRGEGNSVPVLMLTARGDEVDRIVGLEVGADDYLPKPFNPRELVARVRAVLRRVGDGRGRSDEDMRVFGAGGVTLDPATRQVTVDDRPVKVTGAEYRVLEILVRNAGRVVSRESLTEGALHRKLTLYDRSIDTHVSNLRKKLDPDRDHEALIKNIRGEGYLFAVSQSRSVDDRTPE